MFTNSPNSLTFCPLQKTTCPDWTIYSRKGFYLIGCPLLLRTNYRCVESLNISVYVAKCVENVHTLIHYIHFGLLQKMTCHHWTIYSWQSSNSLGCPLMLITNYRCVQSCNISVDVAKCVENVHTLIHYTHFRTVTNLSSLNNQWVCPLLLRTNYRCVHFSVDVAKCLENVHKFNLHNKQCC